MRLLHVIHSIDPRSGGPSHSLRGLIKEQVRQGHQVSLLTTNAQSAEPWAPDGEFRRRMASDSSFAGVELFMAKGYGRRPPWSRFSWTPEAYRWLTRRLSDRRLRPDVIHIHGVFSHLTTLAPRIARKFGIPYVMRPAGTFAPKCLKLGRTLLKQLFTRHFVVVDLRHAAAVHATTPQEAEDLKNLFGLTNVVVIPHGVELPPEAVPSRDEARLALRIPAEAKVVLYLSRLAPKKRISWVVGAMAKLRDRWPDLCCLVVGPDAGAEKELVDAINEHNLDGMVRRMGFVTGERKELVFAASDVLVLPSQSENFGLVVVEALARGLPAVVTPGVASHIYVDASGCGQTVDDSLEGVIRGIENVLSVGRNYFAPRGREYVQENLSWSAICDRLNGVYSQVSQFGRYKLSHGELS